MKGFERTHHRAIANWQYSDIGFVNLTDKLHISEYACIACKVNGKAVGHSQNKSVGLMRKRNPGLRYIDMSVMMCSHHRYVHLQHPYSSPKIHRLEIFVSD